MTAARVLCKSIGAGRTNIIGLIITNDLALGQDRFFVELGLFRKIFFEPGRRGSVRFNEKAARTAAKRYQPVNKYLDLSSEWRTAMFAGRHARNAAFEIAAKLFADPPERESRVCVRRSGFRAAWSCWYWRRWFVAHRTSLARLPMQRKMI